MAHSIVIGDTGGANSVTGTNLIKGIIPNTDTTDLIKSVEIEIGGQKIDKHYSAWLHIYNELFETNHDYRNEMSKMSDINP